MAQRASTNQHRTNTTSLGPILAGESFGIVYMRIASLFERGKLSPGLAPVMAMPHGMRMPGFMRVYLQR